MAAFLESLPTWRTAALTALLLTAAPAGGFAQDAKTVVADVVKAMGAADLDAITYSGVAASGNFGQSKNISFRLASTSIRNYTRTIDFVRGASQASGDTMPPQVPGGPPPQPGAFNQTITPSATAWAQQLQIWVLPWGFLRGAAQNPATLRKTKVDGVSYRVVTWVPAQKAPSGQPYKVTGYINDQNLIDRVETWVEHPILGDMHVETRYSGYQGFGTLKVPTKISQRQAGMETFVVGINEAQANPADLADLMTRPAAAAGRGAAPTAAQPAPAAANAASPAAASERLADGVYRITGGYVSLAVEFRDYVVVLEGGQNEARGLAILAETKRLFPAKRIRYVVNTHPHFDHAGGLPPFVAEGITIITDDNNKYFLEASLGSPRTLVGDVLAKSKKKPKVEGVIDEMTLQDATRSLELHHVEDLEHSEGMLVAYLPKEKILFTADFNVPAAGQPVSPSIATLMKNIERLHLDFDRYVTVHPPNPDRPLTRADLVELASQAK